MYLFSFPSGVFYIFSLGGIQAYEPNECMMVRQISADETIKERGRRDISFQTNRKGKYRNLIREDIPIQTNRKGKYCSLNCTERTSSLKPTAKVSTAV